MPRAVRRCLVPVLLIVCTALPVSAQQLFAPTQDPLAGSRVFGAKGCAHCHSVKGVGGKVGPDLGRTERPRSFYDLASALWNHAPRMAERMRQMSIPRPQLDGHESGDLIAFLFTIDYFERPGNADTGRRLFTEKRCVACHQLGGVGGVLGPSLDALSQQVTPIYLAAAMWNHGPQMTDVMKARGIKRPTFKGSELRDLIAYFGAMSTPTADEPLYLLPGDADEGRRLFVSKRCAACHSVGGQGARIAPDLAEGRLHGGLTDFAAAMWNKAPAMLAAMRSAQVPLPELRPAEMSHILAYLYSARYLTAGGDPRKGVSVAKRKGCLSCHALAGEGGKTASDLARARGLDSPGAALSALWNHSFIDDPRPARAGGRWAEINAEEMADLIALLQSQGRSK